MQKVGNPIRARQQRESFKKHIVAARASEADRGRCLFHLFLFLIFNIFSSDFDYGHGRFIPWTEEDRKNRCMFSFFNIIWVVLVAGEKSNGYWQSVPEPYDPKKHHPMSKLECYRNIGMFPN